MQEPKKKFSKTTKNYLLIGAVIIIIILMCVISNKISKYESDISYYISLANDYKKEASDYKEKLEKAEPWFNMNEEEQQEIIDKQKAEEEAEQICKDLGIGQNSKALGGGLFQTVCPYCGGSYIIDTNDYSEYCETCGYSSYDDN